MNIEVNIFEKFHPFNFLGLRLHCVLFWLLPLINDVFVNFLASDLKRTPSANYCRGVWQHGAPACGLLCLPRPRDDVEAGRVQRESASG